MDDTEQERKKIQKNNIDEKEYEHGEAASSKPVPRIYKSLTLRVRQQSTPNTPVDSQPLQSGQIKFDDSFPRFGPIYKLEPDPWQEAKKKAWQRVKYGVLGVDEKITKEKILAAIRRVEKKATETYNHNFTGTRSNFRMMMIRDGCLFIQMAFMILGISQVELGYKKTDPVFGGKTLKDHNRWMEAMFHVGNQIPLVVLKELIKQNFFQDLIRKGNWIAPASDLRKRVLYEQLVLPKPNSIPHTIHLVCSLVMLSRNSNKADKKPCDVLNALHDLVLGPTLTNSSTDYRFGEYDGPFEFDLEANNEYSIDEESKFPSAVEMKLLGINIVMLKSGGPRSIHFQNLYFKAYLYLPALPVDGDLISVFRSLKNYEISDQHLGKRNHELSSYISLMSDIIQTPQDLSILQKKGIVGGQSNYVEKLPGILRRLNSKDVKLTYNLRNVRRLITNYSSPLVRYQTVINFVVFLTLLQAVFAMLAYFKPPKSPS